MTAAQTFSLVHCEGQRINILIASDALRKKKQKERGQLS